MQLSLQTAAARWLGAGIAAAVALPALAQNEAQGDGQNAQTVEEVVVVGSRRQDRSAADSPVPVDVITGDSLRNLGDTDMDSLLAALVPSYNVDTQPISDAGTVVRPASLRGLPSDATLILLNGKRRHRGSVISFLGGGISDGAHGPDVASIPAIALDRVEVLRDGASAQYGSDAIAGVINFVLREDREGASVEARWGQYYERDGTALTVAGNVGLPVGDNGFLNLSGEFRQADPTSRSVQRADAQGLIDAGNNRVRQPAAQIWGSPEVRDDYKLFANMGVDVGANSEFYAFGNYAQRTVEGGFFYRNPHTRGGVFAGPGGTVKVADLSADGMSGDCPTIPIADNVPDAAAIASVAANPNCFSFIERFPGGFTPQFGGDVQDASLAFGLRGNLPSGWFYDVSAVFGRNEVAHFMHNTINPQLADQRVAIPTTYYPGTYTQSDRVVNFTVSQPLDLGWNAPLHFAAGVELREETFEREAGDPNSYFVDPRLAAQGFGVGSNGFPGLAPRNAGKSSRSSYAAYVDFETNVMDDLLLGAAARYENYDDFGDTLDGKFTFRYQAADNVAFRGAVSTGYRAPTVGQSNVRNVTTAFTDGMLADEATLPPTHPIAVLKGGKALTPEESVNATLGLVFNLGAIDVTVDFYSIAVEGRIARTSSSDPRARITDDERQQLLNAGVQDARSISSVVFFTNEFDTTSRGMDIVATMPIETEGGDTLLTIAANRNDTNVDTAVCDGQLLRREDGDNCTELINDLVLSQLMDALPSNRVSASLDHLRGDWRFLARFTRYGEFFGAPANAPGWSSTYESRWFLDAEAAYDVTDQLTVVVGAQNLLDKYPQKTTQEAQDGVGMLYPENSPYGFNGGFYYLRAIWDFN